MNACIREFKPNGQTMVASPEYGSNGEEPLQFFAAIAKKRYHAVSIFPIFRISRLIFASEILA